LNIHFYDFGSFATNEGDELRHYGAVLDVSDIYGLYTENIVIQNSQARYGGAIYISNIDVFDARQTVIKNSTAINGGAFFLSYVSKVHIADNCYFENNVAYNIGGVIEMDFIGL
jgi:hypothetical protein